MHVVSGVAVDPIVFEWSDSNRTGCAGFACTGQPKDHTMIEVSIVAPALKM